MIGLDTNVVVRYLTQDDPRQAALANSLVEGRLSADNPGFISREVLVEIAWVLAEGYGSARDDIATILDRLLRQKSFIVEHADIARKALSTFVNGKADFADCMIERTCNTAGCECTFTFDRMAARDGGMRLLDRP